MKFSLLYDDVSGRRYFALFFCFKNIIKMKVKMMGRGKMDYANYRCTGKVYVVKKGDSLYKIAKENSVTVNELMRANPYVNVYNMQVGEEICIPRNNSSLQTRCFRINSMGELMELMMKYGMTWENMMNMNPQLRNIMIPLDLVVCIQEK